MAKFKVEFTGFVYVEADTKEEAIDKWEDGDYIYKEENPEEAYEVDEFEIED